MVLLALAFNMFGCYTTEPLRSCLMVVSALRMMTGTNKLFKGLTVTTFEYIVSIYPMGYLRVQNNASHDAFFTQNYTPPGIIGG